MEVKRVRVSVACDACKKRRGKCAGTSPCDYCAEHNVPCCFSTKSKKRGPASKHPKVETANPPTTTPVAPPPPPPPVSTPAPRGNPSTPNMLQGPPTRYGDIKYISEYLDQFLFLPPIQINNILSPTTLHHHFLRFTVLTNMARAYNDHERCMEFFGTARQISGQIYDEPTYDSALAYVLLTALCVFTNDKRAQTFAALSRSHAKELLYMKEWRSIHLMHQTYVMTITLDDTMSISQKHSLLCHYASTIKKTDPSSNLSGYLIGALSLFLVVDQYKARREGILAAAHDIVYSPEVRDRIIQDIERTEHLVNSNLASFPDLKMGIIVLAKLCRTLADLWGGNFTRACNSAKDLLEASTRPEVAELLRNSSIVTILVPNLLTFGTMNALIIEELKYFQPSPTHLDDAGACSLSIHPNINNMLGSHSSHSSHSAHSHSSHSSHSPHSSHHLNHSDSDQEHGSHDLVSLNNNSPSHNSDASNPNTPDHPNSHPNNHPNNIPHFQSVMTSSLSPRKQHSLFNPLDSYSLSNYTHNPIYSSSMHGPLPSPLSLPSPLPSLHHPGPRGPLSLHPLPRPLPHQYASCNFIQEMPPIKDYYGVQ